MKKWVIYTEGNEKLMLRPVLYSECNLKNELDDKSKLGYNFIIDESNSSQWQITSYFPIRMHLRKNNQIIILWNYICLKHVKGDIKVVNLSNYNILPELST